MQNRTLVEILRHHRWDCDKDPNCGNKSFPAHTYLEVYDRLFTPFQNQPINILEIGILRGISLKLWSEYFTEAIIYGADTFERGSWWPGTAFEEVQNFVKDCERVKLVKVNSCSNSLYESLEREQYLKSIPDGFFHVIVDDGSHELEDQIQTFSNFKSKLNKDGIYIIEDIGITNGSSFEPQKLIDRVSELKLLDMRYPSKPDNAIAIYYPEDSNNLEYFDAYYRSQHWLTAPEFQLDYVMSKQREK